MSDIVPIRTALISVSDKTGLVEFAQALAATGTKILSTGGSAKMLREAGVEVTEVSEHTGFPEILDGRVKTLVPQVHGGILGKRHDPSHIAQMTEHGIAPIDLVAVNLYPFEATVARGAAFDDCIENIDIGGPAMIRSAAKNHESVTVLTEPAHYAKVLEEIAAHGGTTLETRRTLAASAYARTAAYDSAISGWFAEQLGETYPERFSFSGAKKQELRYGENPHQSAAFYTASPARFGVATASQHQGKELSYNNYNDTDAAFECVAEFDEPTVVIVKHANPCGVATALNLGRCLGRRFGLRPGLRLWRHCRVNRTLDEETAAKISTIFTEVIIAPDATDGAKTLLSAKKNLRLLTTGGLPSPTEAGITFKSLAGGFLLQTRDAGRVTADALKIVTKRAPTAAGAGGHALRLPRRQACEVQRHRLCQEPLHHRGRRGADEPRGFSPYRRLARQGGEAGFHQLRRRLRRLLPLRGRAGSRHRGGRLLRDPAWRLDPRQGCYRGRRCGRYRHGVHKHAALPALIQYI